MKGDFVVGLCDDELYWLEQMSEIILMYKKERATNICLKKYQSAEQYMQKQDCIDVLFLDVQMKGKSGIELKNFLVQNKRKEIIVFVTNYDGWIREAFGRNVYGFLDKPVSKEKIFCVLDEICKEKKQNEVLNIGEGRWIPVENIMYIKAIDKYVDIYMEEKCIIAYISLKECEKLLSAEGFMRVQRSYIVNFKYILKLASVIVMNDGCEIKVSRGKLKELKEKYWSFAKERAR